MDLEQSAIERIRFAAEMSLRVYKQPLVITYSGGKDSDVLLHLAGAAGIPYEVLHSLTTADAPETVWHMRDTFHRLELAGVKCIIDTHKRTDGTNVTMWNLIPRKLMPPTRRMRYCCSEIKEGGAESRFIATGIRWAESVKRKNRGALEVLHQDISKRLTLMNDNDESRMMMETCQLIVTHWMPLPEAQEAHNGKENS
jgi:3'-phosphoadenosine 5'-phosphosulfate sulfotransferase (PAPS reductase)/FAD synthetase